MNSVNGHASFAATERSTMVASRAASTGNVSPAGELVAMFPPTVPVLRICGDPTVLAASRSAAEPGILAQHPRVGDAGAHPDVTVAFQLSQLRYAIDRDDALGSLPPEVKVDHQVGAAREKCHVGGAR
jgi:hypothetical protein